LKNAVVCFEASLKIDHENYVTLTNLGRSYIDLGVLDKGRALLETALGHDPEYPKAVCMMAVLHMMD
jgi:Tfp pilus assembly protein PilF